MLCNCVDESVCVCVDECVCVCVWMSACVCVCVLGGGEESEFGISVRKEKVKRVRGVCRRQ